MIRWLYISTLPNVFHLGKVFEHFLFCCQFSDTKRQPVHWREASGDNTIVSNVNAGSSPVSLSPTSEIKERENKQVQVKLRLIEQVNILQDDSEEKRSTVSSKWVFI